MEHPEVELGLGVPLGRGLLVPLGRLGKIPGQAQAGVVHGSQAALGPGLALIGQPADDPGGGGVVAVFVGRRGRIPVTRRKGRTGGDEDRQPHCQDRQETTPHDLSPFIK